MPLLVPPNYHEKLCKRGQMAAKGILPSTLKIIIQDSLPATSLKSVGNIDAIRQSTILVTAAEY